MGDTSKARGLVRVRDEQTCQMAYRYVHIYICAYVLYVEMCVYIHIYIYISLSLYIYIYIYPNSNGEIAAKGEAREVSVHAEQRTSLMPSISISIYHMHYILCDTNTSYYVWIAA